MCLMYLNLPIVISGGSDTLAGGLNTSVAGRITAGDTELLTGRITAGEPLAGRTYKGFSRTTAGTYNK